MSASSQAKLFSITRKVTALKMESYSNFDKLQCVPHYIGVSEWKFRPPLFHTEIIVCGKCDAPDFWDLRAHSDFIVFTQPTTPTPQGTTIGLKLGDCNEEDKISRKCELATGP